MSGIVPKMAIRFTSYEWYKQMLADKDGIVSSKATFLGISAFTRSQLLSTTNSSS